MLTKIHDASAGKAEQSSLRLRIEGKEWPIERLDSFTFDVISPELSDIHARTSKPVLRVGEVLDAVENVEVKFRIRKAQTDKLTCGFFDLPLAKRERLSAMAARRKEGATSELQTMSYDELAKGNADKQQAGVVTPMRRGGGTYLKKAGISAALVAAMVMVVGWVGMVIRSQSTIAVNNSVMVGNYQPVNTSHEGTLLDLRVKIGDRVRAGQVLATVSNDVQDNELKFVESELARAQRDLAAYRTQAEETKIMLQVASQRLKTRRMTVLAASERIRGELSAAKSQMKRFKKLQKQGLLKLNEYDKMQAEQTRWSAELKSQKAMLEDIGVAEKAIAQNVIVNADHIVNPLSEVRTKIALAESLVTELQEKRELLTADRKPINLLAPSNGTVFAVYHRPGEVLKVAEEALAISRDGSGWATGQIPAALAANVKPGNKVEIEIPSYGYTLTGIVEGIGHRAVYGQGGYTADFRGNPFDVPIRVAFNDPGKSIPSGLRLNMTIRLRDRVKELNDWMSSVKDRVASLFSVTDPAHASEGSKARLTAKN